MGLNLLEQYKTKIIYGVIGMVIIFVTLLVMLISANGEEEKLNSQIIEPKPLDYLEQEMNYEDEEAIFFKPSTENTQSMKNFSK